MPDMQTVQPVLPEEVWRLVWWQLWRHRLLSVHQSLQLRVTPAEMGRTWPFYSKRLECWVRFESPVWYGPSSGLWLNGDVRHVAAAPHHRHLKGRSANQVDVCYRNAFYWMETWRTNNTNSRHQDRPEVLLSVHCQCYK